MGANILVVDDAPGLLSLMKDVLENRGHRVITAANGYQMVEKAGEAKPDLIIADIMMPGLSGTMAYKSLCGSPATKDIPVIFLTSMSIEEARKHVPDSPNVRLLTKTWDVAALLYAIHELLDPKR